MDHLHIARQTLEGHRQRPDDTTTSAQDEVRTSIRHPAATDLQDPYQAFFKHYIRSELR